jgi:hypothetical protein
MSSAAFIVSCLVNKTAVEGSTTCMLYGVTYSTCGVFGLPVVPCSAGQGLRAARVHPVNFCRFERRFGTFADGLVPQTKRAGKERFISGTLACDVSHMGFADADNLAESNICISLTAVINM